MDEDANSGIVVPLLPFGNQCVCINVMHLEHNTYKQDHTKKGKLNACSWLTEGVSIGLYIYMHLLQNDYLSAQIVYAPILHMYAEE